MMNSIFSFDIVDSNFAHLGDIIYYNESLAKFPEKFQKIETYQNYKKLYVFKITAWRETWNIEQNIA